MSGPRAAAVTAVLDNEALQALADVRHPRHRRVVALLEAAARGNSRAPASRRVVTPTAVRVEARVARTASAAGLGRLRVVDVALDSGRAARAAALSAAAVGTAVDAIVAEAALSAAATGSTTTVFTSDLTDLPRLLAASREGRLVAVRRV